MVYSTDNKKLLMCKRVKEPYLGKYNLVGGKVEAGESGLEAAYRELVEETGITGQDILLFHKMDFTYYNEDCCVEVYAGRLKKDVQIMQEVHPLEWLEIEKENFFSLEKFAGEGNIGHMVEQVRCYGMGEPQPEPYMNELENMENQQDKDKNNLNPEMVSTDTLSVGITSGSSSWVAAIIKNGTVAAESYSLIDSIFSLYSKAEYIFADVVIGLQGSIRHIRPEEAIRHIFGERNSQIFVPPCRQAVYADNISFAYSENKRILGRRFSSAVLDKVQKIKEVDSFLQDNPVYKNKLTESDAELCFEAINKGALKFKKSSTDGMKERITLLAGFIPEFTLDSVIFMSGKCKANPVEVIDAVCLAVAADLMSKGKYRTLPEEPMEDETGILMRIVIPQL